MVSRDEVSVRIIREGTHADPHAYLAHAPTALSDSRSIWCLVHRVLYCALCPEPLLAVLVTAVDAF